MVLLDYFYVISAKENDKIAFAGLCPNSIYGDELQVDASMVSLKCAIEVPCLDVIFPEPRC